MRNEMRNETYIYPAMETMAERAWRYGLETQPGRFIDGLLFSFYVHPDNSACLFRLDTFNPIGVIHGPELFIY